MKFGILVDLVLQEKMRILIIFSNFLMPFIMKKSLENVGIEDPKH